ncbi:bifunctional RNase H/acid phosphatase, partial [Nocardia farcinica]|uniref:bifunctional RNase H/acid phosphatase n=1 Tax=Nocardia farcinica TaxID=37329 RepID=UPI002455DA62
MSYPKVIVEADGGSRGNPGPAGYGAVVFDADHVAVLAERRESVGIATNNVAEYRGLIAGLEAAAELGARTVDVRMDSKLVVEQMSGRWKVKHAAMIPLADRARRLVAGFDAVTFTWIPRAQNAHADRLANEAMDDAAVVEEVRTARDAGHAPTDLGAHRGAARPGPAAGEGAAALPDSGTADTRVLPDTPADPAPGWTGATGRPTRLLLLRHGQTELSVQRRYSGRGNPPLTELGREQAARAAKMLAAKGGIAAVITSPLGPARQTAEAAAAPLRVERPNGAGFKAPQLREREGRTKRPAPARAPPRG